MSSLFRSSSSREKTLAEEMTTTMSTLLEDTILKNIQLKTDIETLGDEIARLSAENRNLLQGLGIRSPASSSSSAASSVSASPRDRRPSASDGEQAGEDEEEEP
ncbi:uncharacterized protein ACA1_234210 [Acanthamoeba castellanii str. Neff]|uniref:Uncharacterized protein n=1 Tax=Acanthamoeba castellanii (strain ATCC 30010 / Neff) TaxID=1257118 RepID=L8H2L2_ACACF|nr:uncharacterized protein ACA1_234210 [Acanthamoeba castellanii str. Neff]ELR18983.1 hypothetical protein ACA1_234210 [Acanthamoeba castellanii str. Neff]